MTRVLFWGESRSWWGGSSAGIVREPERGTGRPCRGAEGAAAAVR
jgi:hypothetical protein